MVDRVKLWSRPGGKVHALRSLDPTQTYCGQEPMTVDRIVDGRADHVTCLACLSWIHHENHEQRPASIDTATHEVDAIGDSRLVPIPSWNSMARVTARRWTRRVVLAGVAGVVLLGLVHSNTPANQSPTSPGSGTCDDGAYVNVDGVCVLSPVYSPSGLPPGATFFCVGGTYSYSQHSTGACSHHGGVVASLP